MFPNDPTVLYWLTLQAGMWVTRMWDMVSGSFWDHLWCCFGVVLGSFWNRFGSVLDPFWDRFGLVLGSFGYRFWTVLISFWHRFDSVLTSFWDRFGIVLGSFCFCFGIVLGSFWARFGIVLGSGGEVKKPLFLARAPTRGHPYFESLSEPRGINRSLLTQ